VLFQSVFADEVNQACKSNGSQLQFPVVHCFKYVIVGMMQVEITLWIGHEPGSRYSLFCQSADVSPAFFPFKIVNTIGQEEVTVSLYLLSFLLFHSQTYTTGRKTTRIAFYGQQVLFVLCRSRIGIGYTAFQPVLFIHEQDGTHCVFRTYTQGFESAYHFYRLYTARPVIVGTFTYIP